jgi:fatty-acyl-CoA synthase
MQHVPLQLRHLLDHGLDRHGATVVDTSTGEGTRQATHAEVGENAARLANALTALGVGGGSRVGTYMWNNQQHLEAYFGVPCMGAVLHPLNIRLAPDECAYIANHGENEVVLVDASLLQRFAEVLPKLRTVRHIVVCGDGDGGRLDALGIGMHDYATLLAAHDARHAWPDVDEDDAAVMCYTSGTTGRPKGVAYSHRSIYLHALAESLPDVFNLSWNDRIVTIVPQFHALAWGLPYAAFLTGAGLVLPDRYMAPDELARLIATTGATRGAAVPTVWLSILEWVRRHPEVDISCLEEAVVGGAPCPPALLEAYDELGVRLVSAWGMTELSPVGACARPPRGTDGPEAVRFRLSQGRLLGPVQARLTRQDGTTVPHDGASAGELEVRGPWVTGSYYGSEGADRFHDGWLRTGDLGTISPDGYFTLTDRSKDVIKSGGEWISSVDLENHLMSHAGVVEAGVIGVPDDTWGERPLAAVVLRGSEAVPPEELRSFLGERFARWQLPNRWAVLETIPKTSSGKFDKVALRQLYQDGKLEVMTVR